MMNTLLRHPVAFLLAIILHGLIALLFVISFDLHLVEGSLGEISPVKVMLNNEAISKLELKPTPPQPEVVEPDPEVDAVALQNELEKKALESAEKAEQERLAEESAAQAEQEK